jgi:LuxR family maltose regulon positive regulatory protein
MPTPILTTKLYIPPPRLGIVSRPRLIERLNAGLANGCRLTLVSASAGFGKTTLVSEWVAQSGLSVGWLSLDEGDNDPMRFLSYLISALQTIRIGIGETLLVALQSHQPSTNETILTALLNEISNIPKNFLLILDDYHSVDSQMVDQSLDFIIEHQPQQMHLVIATREDPPLPLPRLRARGQLTELRAADLRFTSAEAAEFLNQMMRLNLSDQNIAALESRTEGWVTGLQLAALSMQGREDTASFIQAFTGSHRFVLDYLVEEVLRHQPEPIRSFLLQTSILDRFDTPLCNAVTEREDAKAVLDALERSNLFIIPLDDKRQWYRYHHLFAEVLLAHLQESQPDHVSILHLRASEWYERNGLRSDAIRHALAARDFELAAALMELAGPGTESGSIQQATWLSWVKRLPEELICARPVLNIWYAYALLGSGELEAAESRFGDAERWLESADALSARTRSESNRRLIVEDPEQLKSLPATIAIGRAYIAQALGNIPDTVKYASQVLDLVPEGDNFRHAQASMMLGMTYWASGNLQAAERVFAEYTMKLRTAGNIPDAISTSVVLADIRLALGHLHDAIHTLEQLLQFVMDHGEPIPLDVADLHRELSKLHLEGGDLDAAANHLQRGTDLGEKAQYPVSRYRLQIDRARLKTAQGDLEEALIFLDEAQSLHIRSPLPDFHPISALKARIWVSQGKLTKALEWVREQDLAVDDAPSYLREFEHITLARVLIAVYRSKRESGSIRDAISLLERLLHMAEEGKRMGSAIEILSLLALAHAAQGDVPRALESLERALTLAEPEGYARIFIDEGEVMRLLILDFKSVIEKSVRNETYRLFGYVDKLLSAFPQSVATSSQSKTKIQRSEIIEPLSEHELEVLRLLRSELSGPEIARERTVSLNTIRTHTQHIYAKLGVNNRRAAVRRAEELGLL